MTPNRKDALALATLAALVGISLVVLTILAPPATSRTELIQGTYYSFESESLFGNASWLNYSFHGVTFGFHLWCAVLADTGRVCGNATEPTGVSYPYSFTDGLPHPGNPSGQTWIAPDQHEAVQYQQGGLVRLLVAV
ncbi:MAG TPA: hypothetical protein VK424_05710 [Thermoplasmata archaeon]|nr:hypothetical protein [Thermoplasmata archaeon]